MVSPLWKACSEGDLQKALDVLTDATAVDIEVKDHTGATPLIEAVRNGHVELVRALLEKGADPNNTSSQGRPDQYTSDPAILELLHVAQSRVAPSEISPPPVYPINGADDLDKRFYAPPPEGYTYYPTINPSLSTVNEGGACYSPSQAPSDASPNGAGNLPPPEVARMIPCRYFPACRYGAQCMFAHPQTPFFQGAMPPQYPPYDPMGHQYMPQYYPPPPPFQQPPSAHPMSPMSPLPGPPVMHARTPSEVISPMGHFSPNGPPPPPSAHYGHLSPPLYSHPSHVPMSIQPIPLPPLPPLHQHIVHANSGPLSQHNLYNSATSPVPPFPVHQDAPGPYTMPPPPANINYPEPVNGVKLENGQAENYNNHTNHPNHREGLNSHRRGGGRRPSFSNSRKPPCLFFPAGRCKNGDECRFQHISPENGASATQPVFPSARPGPPRARAQMNGPNNFPNLETKMGNLAIRDDQSRQKNGVESSSRSHSSDAGNRPKFQQGGKNPSGGINGNVNKKAQTFRNQQRVPNADEFPVLAGSITPPTRNPGPNGFSGSASAQNGPTAAQVLQAPAPPRKDSKEPSTRGTTPDPVRGHPPKEPKADNETVVPDTPVPVPQEQTIVDNVNKLPVMSFAAAATSGASGAADVSKEVSVSA